MFIIVGIFYISFFSSSPSRSFSIHSSYSLPLKMFYINFFRCWVYIRARKSIDVNRRHRSPPPPIHWTSKAFKRFHHIWMSWCNDGVSLLLLFFFSGFLLIHTSALRITMWRFNKVFRRYLFWFYWTIFAGTLLKTSEWFDSM